MERRELLKGLGGVAGVATVGGIGMLATSSSAVATANSDLGDTSVVSDDGSVQYVATQTTGRLTWDGFDTPVEQGRIIVRVEFWRNGSKQKDYQIHDTDAFALTSDWGGSGEEVQSGREGYIASDADWGIAQANRENNYNDGYPLPENPAPTEPLENDNGQTKDTEKKTRVVLSSTYRLYDSGGNELTGTSGYPDRPEARASTVLTVTNEGAETGFGNKDAEGDGADSAEAA
jgi:hypothetical protein